MELVECKKSEVCSGGGVERGAGHRHSIVYENYVTIPLINQESKLVCSFSVNIRQNNNINITFPTDFFGFLT